MRLSFLLANQQDNHRNRAIAALVLALHERGHQVCVISSDRQQAGLLGKLKGLISSAEVDHASHVQLPFRADRYEFRAVAGGDTIRAPDLPDADVLVATCWRTAMLAHKLPLCKGSKVHFGQSYETLDGEMQAQIDKAWQLPNFKIVSSRKLADQLRRNLGIDVYHVIHNSLDLETFNVAPRRRNETPKVGFLYSGKRVDGTAMAINALQNLRENYPQLEAIALCEPGSSREIALPGWIGIREVMNNRDVRNLLSDCDLWLQTNTSHDFGQIALHALACRCPVAAFPTGAMPELIANGRNGYLTYLIDDTALSESADRVLSAPEDKWQKLSEHAWVTASSYDWQEAAELFEYTLQAAIDHDSQRVDSSVELATSL